MENIFTVEIMKFDSTLDFVDINDIRQWTTGEMTYNLVYDNEGDLKGVGTWGVPVSILKDIVERPYAYDFPGTLDEYNKSLV